MSENFANKNLGTLIIVTLALQGIKWVKRTFYCKYQIASKSTGNKFV